MATNTKSNKILSKENTEKIKKETEMPKIIKMMIVVVLVLSVLLGSYVAYAFTQPVNQGQPISNMFVDVNNDGKVDLITSGNVIYNTDDVLNFPVEEQAP